MKKKSGFSKIMGAIKDIAPINKLADDMKNKSADLSFRLTTKHKNEILENLD